MLYFSGTWVGCICLNSSVNQLYWEISNHHLNISKWVAMQTVTGYVPLNGWFLLRHTIKFESLNFLDLHRKVGRQSHLVPTYLFHLLDSSLLQGSDLLILQFPFLYYMLLIVTLISPDTIFTILHLGPCSLNSHT